MRQIAMLDEVSPLLVQILFPDIVEIVDSVDSLSLMTTSLLINPWGCFQIRLATAMCLHFDAVPYCHDKVQAAVPESDPIHVHIPTPPSRRRKRRSASRKRNRSRSRLEFGTAEALNSDNMVQKYVVWILRSCQEDNLATLFLVFTTSSISLCRSWLS